MTETPPTKTTERLLNVAFANKAKDSPEFLAWLLSRTKFAGIASDVVLARGDNPWHRSKIDGKDSETDILIVLEPRGGGERFALHIENKQPSDKLRPGQPELYHIRASEWVGVAKWGAYSDFQVLLIAPQGFYDKYKAEADKFHGFISYEQIAPFVPEFSGLTTL